MLKLDLIHKKFSTDIIKLSNYLTTISITNVSYKIFLLIEIIMKSLIVVSYIEICYLSSLSFKVYFTQECIDQ